MAHLLYYFYHLDLNERAKNEDCEMGNAEDTNRLFLPSFTYLNGQSTTADPGRGSEVTGSSA